jgi:5-methylcytosine-specific restriction endonuclease McrA
MLRRYVPMKQSRGTVIPADVRRAVLARDRTCVGQKVGMIHDCFGGLELDHVRASGAIGKKSESTSANLVALCATAHRVKTLEGRRWRPVFLDYLAKVAA